MGESTQILNSEAIGVKQVSRPNFVASAHVVIFEKDEIMDKVLDPNEMSIQREIETITRERALKEAREQFVILRLQQAAS